MSKKINKSNIDKFSKELELLLNKYNLKMKPTVDIEKIDCYEYPYSTIELTNDGIIVAEIRDGLVLHVYKEENNGK